MIGLRSLARVGSGARLGSAALAALLAAGALTGCVRSTDDPKRPALHKVRPEIAFQMMHDFRDLPVIDLRTREEFGGAGGHISGAVNVPLSELEARRSELAWLSDRTFLIYCRRPANGDGDCAREALDWFLANEFQRVILMDGGIEDWIRGGFGTVQATEEQEQG